MAVGDYVIGTSRVYQYNIGDIMRNLAYRIGESPKEVREIFSIIHYPQLGEIIESKGTASEAFNWERTKYSDYRQYIADHHEQAFAHDVVNTLYAPNWDEFRTTENNSLLFVPSLRHSYHSDAYKDDTDLGYISVGYRDRLVDFKMGQVRSRDKFYDKRKNEGYKSRGSIRHISKNAYDQFTMKWYLDNGTETLQQCIDLDDLSSYVGHSGRAGRSRVSGVHYVGELAFVKDLEENTQNLINAHISENDYDVADQYNFGQKPVTGQTYNILHSKVFSYHEPGGYEDIEEGFGGFKGVVVDTFDTYHSQFDVDSQDGHTLMQKTARAFSTGQYETIVARFFNNNKDNRTRTETQTAINRQYGLSHGRNLLKVTPTEENGYENPYCRVWTYHHEYGQYKDTIRPFESTDKTGEFLDEKRWGQFRATGNGADWVKTMDENTVLDNLTGVVRVTPYEDEREDITNSVKRCMFSIENLAWRDVKNKNYYLSRDQIGPFGGRIMWFPPYDLHFNESASVNWHGADFIGRGEKIYTYVNTDRSGQLSFKLLIDHPTILNYAELPSGVETYGDDAAEQAILRFFAGCDVLSAKERNPKLKYKLRCRDWEETRIKDEHEVLHMMVFYPNNYSGEEVGPLENDLDFPIRYLLEGVGTQMGYLIVARADGLGIVHETEELIPFIEASGLTYQKIAKPEEESTPGQVKYHAFTVMEPTDSKFVTTRRTIGGYEMDNNENYGISGINHKNTDNVSGMPYVTVTTSNISALPLQLGRNYIEEYEIPQGEGQDPVIVPGHFVYDGEYHNEELNITETTRVLPKSFGIVEFGDGARQQYVLVRMESGREDRPFYYRVDNKYRVMSVSETSEKVEIRNAVDQHSEGMNLDRDALYANYTDELASLGVYDKDRLFSLYDMACFTHPEWYQPREGRGNNGDILANLFEKYKVVDVSAVGFATSTGYEGRNDELSTRRASTAHRWVIDALKKRGVEFDEQYMMGVYSEVQAVNDIRNINTSESKFYRSALVTIELEPKSATTEVVQITNEGFGQYHVGDEKVFTASEIELAQEEARRNNCEWVLVADGTDNDGVDIGTYGSEYEFFKRLQKEDSLVKSKIVDKIKFFDPAYHSISPEGFNARLNFLHQCTRQGPTAGAVAENTSNLSFGRPPVCILRIGDFYYTKILVNSLNITYDETTWDLNQEGAGVQPMMANVNIDFTFIGGSDMTGPISRLQNAVSSNYYANSSIYDKNAEQGEYEPGTPRMTAIRANGIALNTDN